jgi:hypothetical protein
MGSKEPKMTCPHLPGSSLKIPRKEAGTCRACHLCKDANRTAFGAGPPHWPKAQPAIESGKRIPKFIDLKVLGFQNAPMSDFLTTLAEDTQEAARRCRSQDTPVHRREFIRSLFAAAEGFAWHLKRDVFAHTEVRLADHERAALREETYTVSDNGNVKVQTRFLPLISSLRLAIRIVQRYRSTYVIDFNDKGWDGLVKSVEVRNRLVHPKTIDDLAVTNEEVERASAGLDWLMKAQLDIAAAMRDESYKSIDLMAALLKGFSNIPGTKKKSPDKFLELMEVDDAEWRKRQKLREDFYSNVGKQLKTLFEGLAEIFPELESAEQKTSDGTEWLKKFMKNGPETDRTAPVWQALDEKYPGIRKDHPKFEQAQKLVDKFVSEREKLRERVRKQMAERKEVLATINAQLSELDSPEPE